MLRILREGYRLEGCRDPSSAERIELVGSEEAVNTGVSRIRRGATGRH